MEGCRKIIHKGPMGIKNINLLFRKSGYLVLEPSNFAQMYKFSMRLVKDYERLS